MAKNVEANRLSSDAKNLHMVDQQEPQKEERGVVRFLSKKLRDGWSDEYTSARQLIDTGEQPTLHHVYTNDKAGYLRAYADALVKVTMIPTILKSNMGMFTPGHINEWVELYEKNAGSQHEGNEPLTPQLRLKEEVREATASLAERLLSQLHQHSRLRQVKEKLSIPSQG